MKLSSPQAARITALTTGTIITLDPDIPTNRQRVSFSAGGTGLRWLVDGKVFGIGATAQWLPWPGRHVVQIAWERGEVLDEVRGRGCRNRGVTNIKQAPRHPQHIGTGLQMQG